MTRDSLIVGLDAGTSVTKVVAFDLDGREVATVGRPNAYRELPGGAVEQDMARTWEDAAAVLRDLAGAVPDLPRRTLALAVTGQGDGTWLIDRVAVRLPLAAMHVFDADSGAALLHGLDAREAAAA